MTVGKGGLIGGGTGEGGGGWGREAWASGSGHRLSNFFKLGPALLVDWSTGLKDRPDWGLRPNFAPRPVRDPYLIVYNMFRV